MKDYIKHDISNNKFYIEGDNQDKGYAKYIINNDIMNINSTYVDPDYRSLGYARQLVDAAVQYAKEKDYKLSPTCSYAVKVVDRYYSDMTVS